MNKTPFNLFNFFLLLNEYFAVVSCIYYLLDRIYLWNQ
jgi:hypothetical protein